MDKKRTLVLLFGMAVLALNAQKLTFKKDATFKIVQFTDDASHDTPPAIALHYATLIVCFAR